VCVYIHTNPASKIYNGIHENPVEGLVAGNQ